MESLLYGYNSELLEYLPFPLSVSTMDNLFTQKCATLAEEDFFTKEIKIVNNFAKSPRKSNSEEKIEKKENFSDEKKEILSSLSKPELPLKFSPKILVADDEKINQLVMKKLLSNLGYTDISIVENGFLFI